jgi:acyl-CoA reductase-like NAD-dependent aldehyde dehydrogenase
MVSDGLVRGTRANYVADAKKHGGQVVLGGAPMDGMGGYFLQPTIIKNMSREMLTTREETFAPVVGYVLHSVSQCSSIDEPQLV